MDSGLVNSSQTELKLNIHCIDKYSILLIPLTNLLAAQQSPLLILKDTLIAGFLSIISFKMKRGIKLKNG